MPVTVVLAANSRRLATAADVALDIGEELVNAHLAAIEAMLDQASAAMERACDRIFAQQVYAETFTPSLVHTGRFTTGWDGPWWSREPTLFLARVPLVHIGSITADGEAVTPYRVQNAAAGLVYRREGWGMGWHAEDPADDLTVTYLAGYRLPEQTTANTLAMAQLVNPSAVAPMGETLPADVTRLAIEATKVWFHEREPSSRITSRSMGDQSISYSVQAGRYALPRFVLEGLRPWHRVIMR